MESLRKIRDLKEYAAMPHTQVEEEFASILRRERTADVNNLDHVAETVFGRLRALVGEVKKSVHSRDREVDAVAAGFISGVPVLLLGPPGTAKSMVVRKYAHHCGLASGEDKQIDARTSPAKKAAKGSEEKGPTTSTEPKSHGGYFEYLLTNHTMPEELFGGPNLGFNGTLGGW